LYIYDITLGTATQTAVVTIGSNPSGVTGTVDSTAALVVTASGLSSVDLALNAVTGTVALPGVAYPASGVVGGPNGLFYVNAQGALYEVNPHTMTIRATIEMDAFPTKAVFSPDGLSILLANPSAAAVTQPALMVVDVATHAITSHTNWWGLTLSKLIWAPGNRLFATTGNQKLAQFNSDLSGIVEASFPGVGTIPAVIDAFTSKELPTVEGGTGGKYLYVVAPATLYRIDLTVTPNVVSTAAVLSMPRTGAAYFLPVSHATPELTKFGDNQNVALTAVSLPLVARAVDTLGRPVSGATVVFAAPSGTFVGQPMTTTNGDGLTEALIQAPNVAGAFLVSATVGGVQVWFNLTAGGSGGGGGGGGGSGGPGPGGSGLAKYVGDGQVNEGSNPLVEPLTVILKDSNGNVVSGATVTFALTGGGVLIAGDCTNVALATYTCTTDANGLASIRMVVPDVIEQLGSWVETNVTASTTLSDGTTQTVTFVETGVPSNAYGAAGPLPGYLFTTPGLGGTVTVQAGQTLAGAIRINIFARSGPSIQQGMPNIGIHMSSTSAFDGAASPPPVYCSGGTPLSGNDGWVTCDLVAPLTATPGTYPLWVVEGGNTGLQMNVVITAAPPVVRVPTTATPVSGDGQTGATGQALSPLVAVVKDQLGSPMPSITVSWVVISGSATLTAPTSTVTDANGRASTGITLGSTAGAVVVRMLAGTATPATFNLTAVPTVGNMIKISGDGQSVLIGQSFAQLSVKVTDSPGNPLSGIAVSFNVTSGVASPTSVVAATDSLGIAVATFSATSTPGAITIVASSGAHSVTFNLTARLPGPTLTSASFLNGASFQPGVPIGGVVAIKGTGLTTGLTLAAGTCLGATSDGNLARTLPTRLAGMEVWFSTRIAPIFSICVNADGSEQVDVQAPYELAPATITAVVKILVGTPQEVDTYVSDVTVSGALPGIFEYNADPSTRIAVAQRPDGTLVSPTNPARVGETIRLYTTGIGWVLGVVSNQPGYPGQVPWGFTTALSVNGTVVPGAAAEYAQNLIGVFLVSFTVPNQVGSAVPITVSVTSTGMPTVTSLVSHIPITH
jgi:uncharacterized protein (TIGR03437 family)